MALLIGHLGVVGKKNLFFVRFFSRFVACEVPQNAKNSFEIFCDIGPSGLPAISAGKNFGGLSVDCTRTFA